MKTIQPIIFDQLPSEIPSEHICSCVMQRIDTMRIHRLKRKAWIYSGTTLLCIAAAIPVAVYFASSTGETGLWSYTSLAMSDWSYVSSDLKEFMLSVAESLPLDIVILFTALVFAGIVSIRQGMKNFSSAHRVPRHTALSI
jgi:hypothetical protein